MCGLCARVVRGLNQPRCLVDRTGTRAGCIRPPPPLSSSESAANQAITPARVKTAVRSSRSAKALGAIALTLAGSFSCGVAIAAVRGERWRERPPTGTALLQQFGFDVG